MNIMNLATELLVLFLLFTEGWTKDINTTHYREKKCFGLDTCGYTVPDGDIILEYGQPLTITCNLYKSVAKKWSSQNEELPSSRLYFGRNERNIYPNNNFDENNKTAERVVIVNETSIRLTIERPEKIDRDNFFCYFNRSSDKPLLACNNIVVVGVPPQPVTDFSCVSENYEKLVCTWTAPENFVKTQYELNFQVNPINQLFHCPEYPQYDYSIDSSRQMFCNWTLFTDPQYRQSRSTYKFLLHMNNSLGSFKQEFIVDHYKRMRPKPVENLVAISTSPHSISLRWNYNPRINGFPKPLDGKILYKCEYCNNSWHLGGRFISDQTKFTSYELTGLEYPHALYDIRISIKPSESDESMWSDYAAVNRRTDSDIPKCPPKVTQGSYEIVNKVNPNISRDVYVYFQQVQESDTNGQNFTYEVEIFPHQHMEELTKAYARFVNLGNREYTVRIWSKNEIGRSLLSSRVVIPAQPLKKPEQFLKIENNDSYELEWEKPKTDKRITNYTLFWCTNEKERPHQCTGYLDWVIVSNNTFRYNIKLTSHVTYQFAIAANNDEGSSGMRWAECTVVPDRQDGQIRDVWVSQVGSDFVELTWKLECSHILSEVIGYVIYYCKTTSMTDTFCDEEKKEVHLDGNLTVQSARVTNLTPWTTYLLALSVKSKRKLSQPSEYLRNVTLESAPTPPLNITVTEIANSSITVEWNAPRKQNGKIQKYVIIVKNHHHGSNIDRKETDAKMMKYTLTNLESFNKYSIYMQACTKTCSNKSEEITVVTKMGTPAKINRPFPIKSNDTITIISWDKPNPPRGELDYYQMSITHDDTNIESGEFINFTNAEQYTIENCREIGDYHSFYVAIKAVNIINGTHFPGPWSDPLKIYCYRSSWYHIFYVILAIAVFLVCVYVGTRAYRCLKIARDVQVKLPPGLAPAVEHSEKNSDVISRTFAHDPDEELLLERMTEKCQAGDSSGCSSGQESISSSVGSTHLSIDSGTDQPKNVADDNKENSLRLRNVSLKGYVMHDPTPVVNRAAKPAPTPPGNYCLIGVDPSTKPNQETPYVTISDPLPPYVACDQPPGVPPTYDMFKTPNPGYVPFSPKEPASKNTGYVVAGDLNIISTPTSEVKPDYIVDAVQMGLKQPATVWQQPIIEPSATKPGYVSVGDAPPPVKEAKGYVPHRQFESKTLKED